MVYMGDEGILATEIEPSRPAREVIPAGEYVMMATSSEFGGNSKNTGQLLKYNFQIIEGVHTGKEIQAQYNYKHNNPEAERIGRAEISALLHALGMEKQRFNDSQIIHHRPFIGIVGIEFDEANINPKTGKPYSPKNIITGYKTRGGLDVAEVRKQNQQPRVGNSVQPQPNTQPQNSASSGGMFNQPSAAGNPPWGQKAS